MQWFPRVSCQTPLFHFLCLFYSFFFKFFLVSLSTLLLHTLSFFLFFSYSHFFLLFSLLLTVLISPFLLLSLLPSVSFILFFTFTLSFFYYLLLSLLFVFHTLSFTFLSLFFTLFYHFFLSLSFSFSSLHSLSLSFILSSSFTQSLPLSLSLSLSLTFTHCQSLSFILCQPLFILFFTFTLSFILSPLFILCLFLFLCFHSVNNHFPLHIAMGPLNFATSVEDYEMHGPPSKKPKTPRDPMSHRIIEKRRRDRMNNCLADLSRLIPANYMKQGQGRIEKTEIIEMAIRHIKHLQNVHRSIVSQGQCCAEKFYLGFKECEAETIRYFVECEGLDSKDQFCMRVISHLEAASQKFISGNGNCGEYRKEETNTDDKGNINSTIGSECESSKPQNLKAEMVPQSVPAILAPSHESINSATSKQLRNLLSHGNSGFEQVDSGNGSCVDSLSAYSSSESYVSSIPSHEDGGSHLASTEAESHYRSHSSSEGSSSSNSKDSKFTNYKFKHDITKRFSQEEKFSVDPSVSAHHERILEHDRETENMNREYIYLSFYFEFAFIHSYFLSRSFSICLFTNILGEFFFFFKKKRKYLKRL
ncbi:unnamed protein product [Acanthosepion pharaonis]|uniref:Uncharacterized protein n=1 Tax=Acanthosepion pharaonis TaxID=158019 RepID=A0A812DLI2_ACAPH|nr:unnamed protein product [Sepia pharaonis]